MSFSTPPSVPDADEKRQPRQSRLVKAAIECARLGRFDVTIRNVSQTGIGGQAPHMLNRGEPVTVHLPGHPAMAGIVRWVSGPRFGIETDGDIHPDALRAAHGSSAQRDQAADFDILRPPTIVGRRPGLSLGIGRR